MMHMPVAASHLEPDRHGVRHSFPQLSIPPHRPLQLDSQHLPLVQAPLVPQRVPSLASLIEQLPLLHEPTLQAAALPGHSPLFTQSTHCEFTHICEPEQDPQVPLQPLSPHSLPLH
jgi:hypothetical protein